MAQKRVWKDGEWIIARNHWNAEFLRARNNTDGSRAYSDDQSRIVYQQWQAGQ